MSRKKDEISREKKDKKNWRKNRQKGFEGAVSVEAALALSIFNFAILCMINTLDRKSTRLNTSHR